MIVIARAYGGEPLQRVLTGQVGTLAYVLHPSVASAVGIKPFSGVGFPIGDVFEFDPGLFDSLCTAWQTGDHDQLNRAWDRATQVREDAMADA